MNKKVVADAIGQALKQQGMIVPDEAFKAKMGGNTDIFVP